MSTTFDNVYLAVTRTGNDVIIYAFAVRGTSSLSAKEQFENIALNECWEPFDEIEIVSIPSDPRRRPKVVYRGVAS